MFMGQYCGYSFHVKERRLFTGVIISPVKPIVGVARVGEGIVAAEVPTRPGILWTRSNQARLDQVWTSGQVSLGQFRFG